ncbi:hypothetical protein [Diaminobutyricimonas sp. LJ205]|uniref:hypothetical protein n=1 Tax=Diaminobutyricimonas sp. LJ205 TaxID=2683590 RepID=UPI0012F497B4|nr:hypothetical protein [Diaminobutyricimonas sp. LJ205]
MLLAICRREGRKAASLNGGKTEIVRDRKKGARKRGEAGSRARPGAGRGGKQEEAGRGRKQEEAGSRERQEAGRRGETVREETGPEERRRGEMGKGNKTEERRNRKRR